LLSCQAQAGLLAGIREEPMKLLRTSALAATVAFGTIAGSAPSEAQGTMTKEKLVGPWQLVSFKATAGDKVSYPLGEHPGGYIEITPTRYWLMAIDPARKAPAAATLTDAESVSLMKSHVAYTGKYDLAETPDGIKITIHVDAASNQALTGTNRVFYARVDGNKMTLKSPTLVVGTSGVTSVVELEYVKAE
jgi:Lipocalin-like domain